MNSTMDRRSEYFLGLSREARARYERKVIGTSLILDPYVINDWTDSPDVLPDVKWSDMMLYMTVTPSPHTREAIKVDLSCVILCKVQVL